MVSIKGQSEIFGFIVLVVFLVFLGLVFLGFFILSAEDEDVSIEESMFANSLANSFIKAKGGFGDYKGALAACCEGGSFGDSNGCDFLRDVFFGFESKSGYSLRFDVSSDEVCESFGNCNYGVASTKQSVVYEGGSYYLKVYVCEE